MDLMNPYFIYIGIPIFIFLGIGYWGYSNKFKKGRKVANTEFIENTKYFKRRLFEFRFCSVLAIVSLVLALSILMFIIARPNRSHQNETEIRNRDIMLCLDTSYSMFYTDLEVCKELKKFVSELQGERFGITIFNCETVTLVPLTTDYEYVIEVLDQLEESCQVAIDVLLEGNFYDTSDYVVYQYMVDGTTTDKYGNGSSLIGDGLASTVFQFQGLDDEEDRTRVIILATDNQLNGTPFVQIEEATEICDSYDIKLFGAAPDTVEEMEVFRDCCKSTGGKLFILNEDDVAKDLVNEVEKTETSVIYKSEVMVTEYPEKLVTGLVIVLCVYFVVSRRVKL